MAGERSDLIQEEEVIVNRIVGEFLDEAAEGNFEDISYFLGDNVQYIPQCARDMQDFINNGSLQIRVDEQRKNNFALLKNVEGDGVSALVFGSNLIGDYIGIPAKGVDPDVSVRTFKVAFMTSLPKIVFALSQP